MQKAEILTGHQFFTIDYPDIAYEKSKWSDADIAMILNIFSKDAIISKAPFPKITPNQNAAAENHKIAVIGDSFSDQIVYALTQALPEMGWTPDWLAIFDLRFPSRRRVRMNGELTPVQSMRYDSILPEILTKELVILEVSDGYVVRPPGNLNDMEFGATRILLDGLLPNTDNGVIDPKKFLVDGWRPIDNGEWCTTGSLASFAIRLPTNGSPVQIILDVENKSPNQNKPRLIDILVDGQSIGQIKMPLGRGVVNFLVPGKVQWQDALLSEVSLLDTSGELLDILLHGVKMVGVGAGKKASELIATQGTPLKTSDSAHMSTINLINNESRDDLSAEGLGGLESNGKESWRWALGPKTRIKFYVDPVWPDQARQIMLKLAFKNGVPIPGQTVILRLNGEGIHFFSAEEIGIQKEIDADVVLVARKGVNILEIVYQDWNRGKNIYAMHDPRELAVVVRRLMLQGVK